MKRNHKFIQTSTLLFACTLLLSLTSCLDAGDESIILEEEITSVIHVSGIPTDAEASISPNIPESEQTTDLPNATCNVEENSDGIAIASINMTGVWDATNNAWLNLAGTGGSKGRPQNVWVEVDGNPKGIDVYNTADGEGSRTVLADLVFLVDNSGSMSEEANGIAAQIIDWSSKLAASGLDIRFGCVGYGDSNFDNTSIGGGINLTTATGLKAFLDRSSGTSRTQGFEGTDANSLKSAATSGKYNNGSPYNECGMLALRFADQQYNFRNGANRIYVNFTDEPNQPRGKTDWSVEFLKDSKNWTPAQGTIHTVWSYTGTYTWYTLKSEDPKLMSTYTGGTSKDVDPYFRNETLEDLPVTGAMQNSYIIRFTNIEDKLDGQPHIVKITVQSSDKTVKAVKTLNVIFGNK